LFATLFIYILAWKEGAQPTRLVLAGVAVASLFSAGNNALMTFFPDRVSGVLGFMVGGLSAVQWQDFKMILPYTIVGVLLVMFLPNKLNILMLGDEVATGLGLNIERTRRSEEHTSELQSRFDLVCRLLLEKKKKLEA